jgi:hypothetical protein
MRAIVRRWRGKENKNLQTRFLSPHWMVVAFVPASTLQPFNALVLGIWSFLRLPPNA